MELGEVLSLVSAGSKTQEGTIYSDRWCNKIISPDSQEQEKESWSLWRAVTVELR